jgi:hypothetical protein
VVAECFYNLPELAVIFAAKFANIRPILAGSCRKFNAALAACERVSFLA